MKRRIRRGRRQEHIINDEKEISILQYLPEDMLFEILSHLDDIDHLKSTSLVCKLFCSLSIPLVHELTLKNSSLTYSKFQKLFKKFPGLKKIHIKFTELDCALMAISNSGLNLEKLRLPMNAQYPERHTIENMSTSKAAKSIKSLELDWFYGSATQQHVIDFVNLFPSLTELDINDCNRWNDKGFHKFIEKLPNLRKISLSYGNNVLAAESLHPLKSLLIRYKSSPENYYMAGLSQLLSAYPSLESLDIYLQHRRRKKCKTHDAQMSIVVKKFRNLKHITIRSRVVCQATLFSLVQNCPLLETILIERYDRHPSAKQACDRGMARPTKNNYSIKSIKISPESDIWLRSMVESYCPNLRM